MNPSPEDLRHIRRRLRRTAEVLVDDAGLRSNLTDAQAELLLDWGVAQVRETAQQTAPLSDEDAYPVLEAKVASVRQIMRLVNRLMKPVAKTAFPAPQYHMARLLKTLSGLTGREPEPEIVSLGETFIRMRPDLDDERTFQLLMELIDQQVEEIGEEE